MPHYTIEKRRVFDNPYLKIELKDNSNLEIVKHLLEQLQSIKGVNITKNKRTDITVYPSKFFNIDETEQEVKIQLDNIFDGKYLAPVIEKDNLSTISDIAYRQIIEEINLFGLNLEKYKTLYSKFDEEGFRDFFLPHLNSISKKYSATGETFNKIGKTDMLIQDRKGTNVFIAECKLWHGEKELLKAIDQMLVRYITWRDERTAIIIFNKINQNFSNVLSTAKAAMMKHSLCKELVTENSATSIAYIFKNAEDPHKTIQLELIIFNCQ